MLSLLGYFLVGLAGLTFGAIAAAGVYSEATRVPGQP